MKTSSFVLIAFFFLSFALESCNSEENKKIIEPQSKKIGLRLGDRVVGNSEKFSTTGLNLQQAYSQGRAEAEYVFNMFYYRGECTTWSNGENGPGNSLIQCWRPYNESEGHQLFANFCYDYQAHMLNTACNTSSCEFRSYTLEILRGFNEYLMLNPDLFNHSYFGNLSPSPCQNSCN